MSEEDVRELSELIRKVLECKTQAHRQIAVEMVIRVLEEKALTSTKGNEQ